MATKAMRLTRSFQNELHRFNQRFETDFAIISSIEGNAYTIIEIDAQVIGLEQGKQLKSSATYCSEVIRTRRSVVRNQISHISSDILHPIFTALQLEAYLGVPLIKDNSVVGTLNFSSFDRKSPEWTQADIDDATALAHEVEACLAR